MGAKNAWMMELAKADKELLLEGLPSVELSRLSKLEGETGFIVQRDLTDFHR